MPIEFINPNWHVILIHYPIGLLTIGLVVEIISCFKPKGGFRAAGRWMIAIGALLALPTLTSGLYAFRDTVSNDPIDLTQNWRELSANSPWNKSQWEFMSRHIWYMSCATGLGLLVVFLWLANPDRRRRKLYWLILPAMLATVVLVGIGAWHSGEAVYRYGTAVARENSNPPTEDVEHDQDYYLHPLQAHVVLAGLAVAASIVGMALMVRKWEKPQIAQDPDDLIGVSGRRRVDPLTADPARDRLQTQTSSIGPYGSEEVTVSEPPRVYPGWFYIAASLIAVATAFFGAWSTIGELADDPIQKLREQVLDPERRRLLWHSILGISIVALPLILGLIVRLARRQRLVPLILTGILLIVIGLQIWIGIVILYDGYEGPAYRFNAAAGEKIERTSDVSGAANAPATTRATTTTAPTTSTTRPR